MSLAPMGSIHLSDGTTPKILVVMVPLAAQGHLNQLLHFSRTLALRGQSLLYVAPSTHIQQVRHRIQGWDPSNFDIRFYEVPMPDLPSDEPNTESSHKYPTHLIPFWEAMEDHMHPHMDSLFQSICSSTNNRVVVVHDMVLGWIQPIAAKYGIPAYVFRPVGAYASLWLKKAANGTASENVSLKRCIPERRWRYIERQISLLGPAKGVILNSFSAMDSRFINEAREKLIFGGRPVWTVGPLLPEAFFDDEHRLQSQEDSECLKWLDTQAPASVLYVSFGSLSSFSASEIQELAVGLERCGQPFLWVLRISDSARFSTEAQSDWVHKFLPVGYERTIQGRGFIASDWVPQLQVLRHKSTGGFLTHCGWNSTLESICAGVPMVAWPLHADQFANSTLIARELMVGMEVKKWTNREEHEMVSAEEVEKAVRRLMEGEEGVEMRRKAQELRDEAHKAVSTGGSSCKDLDALLHDFSQQLRG